MPETAIKFENISKEYRLGLVSTRTLSHDLNRWWAMNIIGKEDPYLKIGETNERATKGSSDYVWALRDINLEVKQGEVLGIIGKNGAGKSTLLKILSKVTAPTTGMIKVRGRIASLLEVGTGFHPEMTGRENIYMNGAIMGMTKGEIRRKLDEIIEFAGVARYLDTPVKRYSSGMTVRLGFAVAAHLEPEILVVDEVLAVGDAEFQKKAIGKMQDISKGEGRTVLFVSHNMTAVKNLCHKGIVLENGNIKLIGEINSAVDDYLSDEYSKGIVNNYWNYETAPGCEEIKVKSAFISITQNKLTVDNHFDLIIEFWVLKSIDLNVNLFLYDINQICMFSLPSEVKRVEQGKAYRIIFKIPRNFMNDGIVKAEFMFVSMQKAIFIVKDAVSFEIFENRVTNGYYGKWIGVVRPTFIEHDFFEIL